MWSGYNFIKFLEVVESELKYFFGFYLDQKLSQNFVYLKISIQFILYKSGFIIYYLTLQI